jgi:hypothetical protein
MKIHSVDWTVATLAAKVLGDRRQRGQVQIGRDRVQHR